MPIAFDVKISHRTVHTNTDFDVYTTGPALMDNDALLLKKRIIEAAIDFYLNDQDGLYQRGTQLGEPGM